MLLGGVEPRRAPDNRARNLTPSTRQANARNNRTITILRFRKQLRRLMAHDRQHSQTDGDPEERAHATSAQRQRLSLIPEAVIGH